MKNSHKRINQIIESSPEILRNTKAYQQNVENIRHEINLKYAEIIKHEKNVFQRLLLKIKKRHEIKRAINQLTSLNKLYLIVE